MFERTKAAWAVLKSPMPTGVKVTAITEIFGGILKGIDTAKLFDFRSYLEAGTKKCWALFKATDYIAKAGMDTPFRLQKKGGDGVPVKHAAMDLLFENPNPHENMVELIYKLLAHLVLTGNGFWLKDQTNFENERPSALYPLNPKRMKVVVDPKLGIIGYLYRVEGPATEMPLEVSEVLHFRVPHANNDYWGLGVVESAEDLFQGFINRSMWENRFWKNGAAPSGVLILEDQVASPAKWEEAKEKFQKEYGGVDNSGKIAWLNGKWKYLQVGLTNAEMQAIESDKWTVEKIAMQCGVPLSVMGVREAANFATARIDELRFRRYTVKPLLTFIQKTITSDIVMGFSPDLEFVFDISGLVDLDQIVTAFCPMFDRGGISINELRTLAGFQPDPNNDLWNGHYINAGLTPLELSGVADQGQTQQQAQAAVRRFIESTMATQNKGVDQMAVAVLKLIEISGGQQKILGEISQRLAIGPGGNGNGHHEEAQRT